MTAGILIVLAGAALMDPLRPRLVVAICLLGGLLICTAIVSDLLGSAA
jgi:hypothetical protein